MLSRIADIYARVIAVLIVVSMLSIVVSVTLMILGRYVPFIPRYLWTDESARFGLIYGAFLASTLGLRERKHFYVDVLPKKLPMLVEAVLTVLYYGCALSVAAIFVFYGGRFFQMGRIQQSEITNLNLGSIYIVVPITGASWMFFLIENVYRDWKRRKA